MKTHTHYRIMIPTPSSFLTDSQTEYRYVGGKYKKKGDALEVAKSLINNTKTEVRIKRIEEKVVEVLTREESSGAPHHLHS